MQNDNNNVYSICIYDDVENDYKTWDGENVESKTDASRIKEQIDSIPDGADINVYISSNGGDVKVGLAIYSCLLRKQANKTAYIDGFACSIASIIPMACDRIVMYPTSLLMIHNASGCCYGNAEEHRKFADDLDVISSSAVTAYLEKSKGKLKKEELDEMLQKETWLTAADCLKIGLCDEIALPQNDNIMPEMQVNNAFTMYRKMSALLLRDIKQSDVQSTDVTDKGTSKTAKNPDLNKVIDTFINQLF